VCLLSLGTTSSTFPITVRLQYDDGRGFGGGEDIVLFVDREETLQKLIYLPKRIMGLRLAVFFGDSSVMITSCRIREIGKIHRAVSKGWSLARKILKEPRLYGLYAKKAFRLYQQGGLAALKERVLRAERYPEWVTQYDTISDVERRELGAVSEKLQYKPLISVVMPVYNVPERYLRAVIQSVCKQVYSNWELCIADDNSPNPNVRSIIKEYAERDPRIKYIFRSSNGHIAEATNTAATLASGEFIAFLDHDDELREHALLMMVRELNTHPDADLLYSDEDKISEEGVRHSPHFKSDWNPELLLCQNYVCHFTMVRRSLFAMVGGIRKGFDGAQDWDFVLRASEATSPAKIRHIPHVLYHWRVIDGSTAKATEAKPYVTAAQIKAVSEHLRRKGEIGAEVESLRNISMLRVRYPVPSPEPLVSLIVPTYNQCALLAMCVEGILKRTAYKNIELIVVDNRSDDPETLAYLRELAQESRVVILRDEGEFNFARLNNRAVQVARGDIVGFINNDVQVIEPQWLNEMVSNIVREGVGTVGARLLYPNGTVQHAGVILGIGGVANHIMKLTTGFGYFSKAVLAQNFSAVTAACMITRKDVFLNVGGFDEKNFAVAYNDVDLCLKIREAGQLIVYTPYAELVHHESISRGYEDSPEKKARFEREFAAMREKWGKILDQDPYFNPNFSRESLQPECAFPPYHPRPWEAPQ
jgi:GT2 family glycosyltransferase